MFPFFGDGIFTQEGDAWHHSRELLRPQFAHRNYEDMELFREVVDNLITVLPQKGTIDLQPLFFRLTLDTTTAFLFGDSVNSLQALNTVGESSFASAFNIAQDYVAKRLRLQDLYWLIGGKKFKAACDGVHRFADMIIDRNLSRNKKLDTPGKYVFLEFLEKNTSNRTELRSQIINILIAGRDTTACLLSWIFLPYTGDVLPRLTYVALRLYPSVPVNMRTAIRDTILPTGGGPDRKSRIFVNKGENVAYSVYSMHRRPDLYGMDAELFRPERWDLEEDLPMHHNPINAKWGYLPFNGGPRVCLGSESNSNPEMVV
ncbi:MAG: hypothetical protein Q9220_007821 [cf. Caloplaca sp. 1 TL-2023]